MQYDKFELHAELIVRVGDELFANAKRIELLRQIDRLGNLTHAAKVAGYSYKGAWDSIDQMASMSCGTLITRRAGGKGGGRTELTERGRQVLRNFSLIEVEHQRFISRLNKLANGLSNDYALESAIAMKTSARNQYAGIIVSMTQGPVNDELGIFVNGNLMITASITHGSCRDLQLEIGAKVFVLIKASALTLCLPDQVHAGAPKNAFLGTVHTLIQGENQSELALSLVGGTELIATLPNARVASLALRAGATVVAEIEPSNVIIGVAA